MNSKQTHLVLHEHTKSDQRHDPFHAQNRNHFATFDDGPMNRFEALWKMLQNYKVSLRIFKPKTYLNFEFTNFSNRK